MIEMSVDKETVCLPDSTDLPLLQHCSEPLRTCVKAPNGSAATRPSMDHPDPPIATPEQPSNMADSAKQTESTRLAKRSVAPPSQDRNGLQQASHQQPRPNKRRHSANSGSFKHPVPGKRRRGSRNWDCEPVLPTDFQLGGNIFDPLNLNSLLDEEVNRALNAQTPTSSPLPAKGGDPVEILIPRDITDPLNLNCCVPEDGGRGEVSLLSPLKGGGRRRHRNRHHGGGAGGGGGGGAAGIGGGGGGGRAGAEGGPPQPDISTSQPAEGTSSPSPSSALQSSHSGTVVDTFAPEDPKGGGGGGGRGAAAAAAAPPQGSSSSMNGRRDNVRRSSQPSSSTPTPQATIPQKTPSTFSTRQRKWRRAPSKSESTGAPDGRPPPTALTQASAPPAGAAQPTNHRRHQHQPKATQHNQKQQQQKKFQYGNYNKYYGYRNPGLSEDPRIRVLKPQWFRGKTVLDLGCNSGHLTLTIARDWQPARIVGLDIDGGLIRIARQNIRHYLSTVQPLEATCGSSEGQGGEKDGREKDDASEVRRKENEKEQEQDGVKKEKEANHQQKMEMVEERRTGYRKEEEGEGESGGAREQLERGNVVEERLKNGEDGHTEEKRGSERPKEEEEKPCDVQGTLSFPVSLRIIRGPIAAPPLPDTHTLTHSPGNFPANVSFVTGNYVLERDLLLRTQREEYDVIMCLSVTKWVHLNWGDDGLKRLFQRVYRHLLPGGLFILEPQPWESYCRRKGLTDTTYKNYHSIRFKPDQFSSYLISEVGFSCYELIGTPLSSSRGFQRPIYVFRKGPSIPK